MPVKQTLPADTIDAIKQSIVRGDSLLNQGVPINLDENIANSTNCYAYSIGIMYNFLTKTRGFYNPGFTEYDCFKPEDTPEDLMTRVKHDLDNLGIKYREIMPDEKTKLNENEYLVKLFMADPNVKIPRGDFHFIRQDRKSGKWFHKLGWVRQPDIIQSDPGFQDDSIPGDEPDTFTTHCEDGFSYVYYEVGYLAIEEP